MTHIKEGGILNTPKWNQDMCTAFLEDPELESHLEGCRTYYREKLAVFLDTMAEHFQPETGVTWTHPEGGLFLWVSVPEHIDTDELFFEAIEYIPSGKIVGYPCPLATEVRRHQTRQDHEGQSLKLWARMQLPSFRS